MADKGLKSLTVKMPSAKLTLPIFEKTVFLSPETVSYILRFPFISESIPAKNIVPSFFLYAKLVDSTDGVPLIPSLPSCSVFDIVLKNLMV